MLHRCQKWHISHVIRSYLTGTCVKGGLSHSALYLTFGHPEQATVSEHFTMNFYIVAGVAILLGIG